MALSPASSQGSGAGGGTVTSVTAADASIVVAGTAAAPTVAAAPLNVIATLHAATAAVDLASHKITSMSPGTTANDGATFGQLASALLCDFTTTVAQPAIDTNTVLGGNLPQTSKDLQIYLSVLATSVGPITIRLTLNNNVAANYYWQGITATTTVLAGVNATGDTAITCGDATSASTNPTDVYMTLGNYPAAAKHVVNGQSWMVGSGTGSIMRTFGGTFLNASAITRIAVTASAGNFDIGSRLTIVGVG